MRTFLIDGVVAGTWRLDDDTLNVRPFRTLRSRDHRGLRDEAELLLAFLRPEGAAPDVHIDPY